MWSRRVNASGGDRRAGRARRAAMPRLDLVHPQAYTRRMRALVQHGGARPVLREQRAEPPRPRTTGGHSGPRFDFGAITIEPDGPREAAARAAGARAQAAMPSGPLLAHPRTGPATLTPEARARLAPTLGGADDARIHVDDRADAIATAAGARGVTVGRDVYLARPYAAVGDAASRGVLGHELAHVAQRDAAPGTLFRDGPPHYPSAGEQRRIEQLLARDRVETVVAPPPASAADTPAPPEVRRGTSLSADERVARARSLMPAMYATLTSLGGTSTGPVTTASAAEAMALATRARDAIVDRYGRYIPRMPTLTDTAGSAADRIHGDQVQVAFGAGPRDGAALANTILVTHCAACLTGVRELDDESRQAVLDEMKRIAMAERGADFVQRARALVGGSYNRDERILRISEYSADPYGTAVHELIHAATHPAFAAAFMDERNIIEGFTEYFSRELTRDRSTYAEAVAVIERVRSAMSGTPYLLASDSEGAEESLRQAYFAGRLDLIGWRPSDDAERDDVARAGGAPAWDPTVAATEAAAYHRRWVTAQHPHANLLGVGILLHRDAPMTLSVRYARVFARLDPLERGRLYAEGQLVGAPTADPVRLGGSLGLGIEYQEPWFYATGGVRLQGTAAVTGGADPRVDVAPFVGLGIRAWQRVRIGAETTVLLPLTSNQSTVFGGGGVVAVEF